MLLIIMIYYVKFSFQKKNYCKILLYVISKYPILVWTTVYHIIYCYKISHFFLISLSFAFYILKVLIAEQRWFGSLCKLNLVISTFKNFPKNGHSQHLHQSYTNSSSSLCGLSPSSLKYFPWLFFISFTNSDLRKSSSNCY